MTNKLFIDAGANIGQSIDNFIKHWPNWNEYLILSYEANPNLKNQFERFSSKKNIKFFSSAIWSYDGFIDFYLSTEHNFGSSINKNKKSGRLDKTPISVPCVDIDRIIREHKDKEYIILKLDIEGAEYELLNYMFDKGTFNYINELYIEFHTDKVNKTKENNNILIDKLKSYPNLKLFYNTSKGLNFI